MTRPGPVRLTREDWRVIYHALLFPLSDEEFKAHLRVRRRIGDDDMAARDRGVARVKRRQR